MPHEGKHEGGGRDISGASASFAEEKDSSEAGLSPLLEAFATFGTSDRFSTKLEAFFDKQCVGFEDADPSAEQSLVQMEVYNEFVAVVEKMLEEFCDEQGTTSEAVFEAMQEALREDDTKSGERVHFLPEFMRNTEYTSFLLQMKERAIRRAKMVGARRLSVLESKEGDGGISGVWRADKPRNDYKALERYLKEGNCPWLFRKIFRRAAQMVKDVICEQKPDKVKWTYTLQFFGTSVETFPLGEEVMRPNLWKVMCACTFTLDEDGSSLIETIRAAPHLPEGTVEVIHTSLDPDDPNLMVQTYSLDRPDREGVYTYKQHFKRQSP